MKAKGASMSLRSCKGIGFVFLFILKIFFLLRGLLLAWSDNAFFNTRGARKLHVWGFVGQDKDLFGGEGERVKFLFWCIARLEK
jgi:hypothetical protein